VEGVIRSRFDYIAGYATRIGRDLDAVKAALATPWSNGVLEGHVTRLRVIKRQMYGRAGLELLTARVFPFVEAPARPRKHQDCVRTRRTRRG
jgi:transposase